MRFAGLLLLAGPILLGVGGCTHVIKPPPSAAIVEARAAAAERLKHARDPSPCVDPRTVQDEDATVIRFLFQSADLDPTATRVIGLATAFARCDATTPIVLAAEPDGRASEAAQKALVVDRLAAMRKALTTGGVPDSRITTVATRASAPAGSLSLLGRNLGG